MIAWIIRWSVKARGLIVMAALVLTIIGIGVMRTTPVDALPDLSDVQVIIRTTYPGQAPQIVENQVTYPITTTMLSVPGARAVRGYSFVGNASLGPDATGVGWIYEYALVDRTGRHDLTQLRSIQDWFLRFELKAVPGVAEVASIGGMVRQYQVIVDPQKLASFGVTATDVSDALRRANQETGGAVVELAEA
ncbi:MAG: CusA/CzcA family heavy metal efflux RND transporter, partial [Sphingomonas hengshuiensis]